MKAACTGCRFSGVPRPSMVVILSSWCMTASVKHELMRRPSTSTVQAPHCPWSQPFLLPVRCRCSPDDVFFIGLFASTGGSVRVGDNLAHQSSALTVSLSQALLDDTLPTVI